MLSILERIKFKGVNGEKTMIKQLSIFVRNSPGELEKILKILADNDIQIRATTVAETADYGIFRVIVNDPDKAYDLLHKKNVMVGETDVFCIEMSDKPGGLLEIANILGANGVNIEYLYAFVSKGEKAVLVIQVEESHYDQAEKAFSGAGIKQFKGDEIYNL